jgi:hypothetical protein
MRDRWSSFARVFSRPADGPLQHGCIEISTLCHPDRKAKEPLIVAQVRGGEGDGAKGACGALYARRPKAVLAALKGKTRGSETGPGCWEAYFGVVVSSV